MSVVMWNQRGVVKEGDMYLGIWDADKKRTAQQKLDNAIAAYWRKYDRAPAEVLCNEADYVERDDVLVRAVGHVQVNCFLVGDEHE